MNQSECPTCGKISQFIPPSKTDRKRRKTIVNFICPNGHEFTKEFDYKG
jgi:predicted RNA-binding Zn-ribbon protein involved in translation (DUF1610 family)